MSPADLTYSKGSTFTTFYPETPAGNVPWRQMLAHTDGTGQILTFHLADTLRQLRAAGYIVRMAPKLKPLTVADLAELGIV